MRLEKRETLAVYSMLSQAYQNVQDIENANINIAKGVKMASDRVKLCEHFLEGATVTGNIDLALWWADECIRIEPNNGDLYNIRGLLYSMKGEHAIAIASYKSAVELGAPVFYKTSLYHKIMNK
ncbi:MAG: hypothetical protein FWH27_10155 [Planctomycetaceae bacterium]|nr:hypothetical protein [Planctomycetaceae bacterium]